jgi:hypothetical protein
MSFYSDQANQFIQLAQNIQTRITNAGSSMDDATRSSLDDQRDGLLEQANKMILADIQAALGQLNLDQPRLAACTANLNNAVKTVQTFNQIVAIGEAGLNLVTACVSANPGAIITALSGAEKAVASALGKSNVVTMPPPTDANDADAGTITTLAASAASKPTQE